LAGLDSAPCGRGSTTFCGSGGDAGRRGLTVSRDPGAVLLAAAAWLFEGCRTSVSARSTDRTSTTPGEGGTRRGLRGDPVESVDDQVVGRECRRASVHGDIGLDTSDNKLPLVFAQTNGFKNCFCLLIFK